MLYCKWLVIIIFYLIINFCPNISSAATNIKNDFAVRIAVVDIQSILENSIAMQAIKKSIGQINQRIQHDIQKKDAEHKKIAEELEQKRGTLSQEIFEHEVNIFNIKVSEIQKDLRGKKIRLERAYAEAGAKVHTTTIDIIADLAKIHNLNLVISRDFILFAKDNLNITPKVIEQLNNKLKHIKINYK